MLSVGNWKANMKVVLAFLGTFVVLATLDFVSSTAPVCGGELITCPDDKTSLGRPRYRYHEYFVSKDDLRMERGKYVCPEIAKQIKKLKDENKMVFADDKTCRENSKAMVKLLTH